MEYNQSHAFSVQEITMVPLFILSGNFVNVDAASRSLPVHVPLSELNYLTE